MSDDAGSEANTESSKDSQPIAAPEQGSTLPLPQLTFDPHGTSQGNWGDGSGANKE